MPNAIFQLDEGQILNDLESRVRRLETYNYNLNSNSVLLTLAASASLTGGGFPFSATWAQAYSLNFTLSAKQTVLCIYQQSYYPSGGTASYCYVGQNINATGGPLGAIGACTNGVGVANANLMVRAASLAAGTYTWYGLYRHDAGGATTYNTFGNPQVDIYIIGG